MNHENEVPEDCEVCGNKMSKCPECGACVYCDGMHKSGCSGVARE